MNEFLRNYLDNLSGKKNTKTTTQFFENLVKSQGPELEYNILTVLFESIDWKDAIDNQNSKDTFKIEYLKKKLKQLKIEPNFVDYFGPCISECTNRSFLYEKFRDILKVLKIGHPFNLIFSTSFAMDILDDRQELLGTALLKEHLQETSNQEKVQPLPTDFILTLAEFLKANDKTFKDVRDQVKFFFENYVAGIKDMRLKCLFSIGEPEMVFSEASRDNYNVDLSKIMKTSPRFFSILKELTFNKTNIQEAFRLIFKEITTIPENEICESIILMCFENCMVSDSSQKANQSADYRLNYEFAIETLCFNPEEAVACQAVSKLPASDPKTSSSEWKIDQFIKLIGENLPKKVNWDLVLKSFSQFVSFPNPEILSIPKFYELLFSAIDLIRKSSNVKLSTELVTLRWNNLDFQFHFLFALSQLKDLKSPLLLEVTDKSKDLQIDAISPSFIGFVQQLDSFLFNIEFMSNLFELSQATNNNPSLFSFFELLILKNFEGTFYILVALSQKTSHRLLKELLKTSVLSILNAQSNFSESIELFLKANRTLFVQILSEVCNSENSCIFLSKIIDFSQNIKDFVVPLTQTEYHYFSISLSLLAVKREYLRLENWIEERIATAGISWINEFLFYVQKNFLDLVKNNTNKKTIDEVLEKSQLTKNVIAIIFENFLLSEKNTSVLSKQAVDKIKNFYQLIQGILPDLSQVNSSDTEKKANQLLEQYYEGKTSIDEFITHVQTLKLSTGNREQEILSCIIINIIDEFRFYHNFPEKELYLTSEIYGRFISNRIIDGKALTIFLKAISEGLEKDGRMFNFGLKALSHFVMNMDLNIPNDFYKILYANEKLKKNHFQMLFELRKKLAESDREKYIDQENLRTVTKNMEILNKEKEQAEEEELAARNEARLIAERKRPVEKTLTEMLSRTFEGLEKSETILEKFKEKLIYWLNGFDDRSIDRHLREFEELVKEISNITWFAKYLVFKRVPSEPVIQNAYRKLIYRSNIKGLYKAVYKNSMKMINLVIDFVSAKESLLPEEKNTARFCGKWIGLITLVCNKPILLTDFDIKKRLFECIENKTISNVIPIICQLLKITEKSTLFNPKVPFINSIFDILREILHIGWINHTTKIFIEVVFTEFEIHEKTIYKFGYIAKNKNNETEKENSLHIRSLPQYIKVDNSLYQEFNLLDKLHVDIKQIIALAINSSIQDIIRPVLERSVKIALETTRELVLKDFAFESDEKKIFDCAKNMIQNLSWNLALVTCREPLRSQLSDHLHHLLRIQSDLDEPAKKILRETLANANLELACQVVKKIVIENSIEELNKDDLITVEMEFRKSCRQSGKPFVSTYGSKYLKDFPASLNSPESLLDLDKIEIYLTKHNPTSSYDFSTHQTHLQGQVSESVSDQPKSQDENKIQEIIKMIEQEFESQNTEEKLKHIHNLYNSLRKSLENNKNIEVVIPKLTDTILSKIFTTNITFEILRYYADILILYRNHTPKLPIYVTNWMFKLEEPNCYKHEIIKFFLKNYLLDSIEFDIKMAEILSPSNLQGAMCTIVVLRNIVIEEKIFSIYSFPKIVNKLVKLSKTDLINGMNLENSIFVDNLVNVVENDNAINSLRLNLSNLEPEYNRLFIDMKGYFAQLNDQIFALASETIKMLKDSPIEENFFAIFEKHNTFLKEERSFITYFSYLFEIVINLFDVNSKKSNNLQENLSFDYSCIDSLTLFILAILQRMDAPDSSFEKIITSFIMVLTKKHFCESSSRINQKPFFRVMYNLIQEIHNPEFKMKEKVSAFDIIIVQTIHILQPLKFPSFAFAWMQLISSPALMNSILKNTKKEVCTQYTMLIIDLMMFVRDVFTLNPRNRCEMETFYKGILKILLILIINFPDYLCENSFIILEEISPQFIQFRNMILSAYPKDLKSPDPFEISNQNYQNSSEYKTLPVINNKIEYRVSSHSIQTYIINFMKTKDQKEIDKIINALYIVGYKNDKQINIPLLESFVVYVPYLIHSRLLIRIPKLTKPICFY